MVFKKTLSLVALAALLLSAPCIFAQEAAKKEGAEFHGYWRLGFNTNEKFSTDTDAQGNSVAPDSRHVKNPSYFWLQLKNNFENGSQAVFRIDSAANHLPSETDVGWKAASDVRIRELYFQLPIDSDVRLWAGARFFEFEDIRIFDKLNFFNIDAQGVGLNIGGDGSDTSGTHIVLGFAKNEVETDAYKKLSDEAKKNAEKEVRDQKQGEINLLARTVYNLGEGLALKPMLKVKFLNEVPKDEAGNEKVGSDQDIAVGAVLSRWGDGDWGNTHLWINKKANKDLAVTLGESASYTFGDFGVLLGAFVEYTSFDKDAVEYDEKDGKLVADGTTGSTIAASLGVQPVYFITDKFHVALDLNQTFKTKKTNENDFNATLITPIVRYTIKKAPLSLAEIYTSVTYGMYDWDAKKDSKGKATDNLITTQTGFEFMF